MTFIGAASAGCFGSSDNQPATDAGPSPDGGDFDATGGSDAGSGQDATTAGESGADASADTGADVGSSADGGCAGDGGPGTFTCTGNLAVPRIAPGGAVLTNGKVLVAGGWNSVSQTLSSAEIYDPASATFAATGGMGSEHLWAGWASPWPVLANGKVLTAGGLAASGALLATAELYDPAAGTFSPTGPLGTAVLAFGAVTLPSGEVLFLGGYSSVTGTPPTPGWEYTAGTNQVQGYDPTSGMFSPAGTLAEPRLFGCNVLLPSGTALAIGGWQGVPAVAESNIERYDPVMNQWTPVGALANGVTCNADAFVLPGGAILLDTSYLLNLGTDAGAPTATPTTNALASTSAMFVQLANGDVLAAGGEENNAATAHAQVYRVSTGLWTAVGDLHQPRSAGRAFLLPSGEVLIAGGSDANGAPLATAEIYHP